jgi:hypothetical protein
MTIWNGWSGAGTKALGLVAERQCQSIDMKTMSEIEKRESNIILLCWLTVLVVGGIIRICAF